MIEETLPIEAGIPFPTRPTKSCIFRQTALAMQIGDSVVVEGVDAAKFYTVYSYMQDRKFSRRRIDNTNSFRVWRIA